jgi:addiction module HigA family antidote
MRRGPRSRNPLVGQAQALPPNVSLHHNDVALTPSNPIRVILSVRVPTSQPPERPGQILREEFIKTGRLTQAALAQRMGVPVTKVRGILSGEEGITAETALLLEAALGVEAEFWIRAQFVWDCYRLREVERRTAVLEHGEGKGKRSKS